MKQQKGFTLIELMIVIAIIGILASIAVPMYRDYITKTRMGTVLASVQNIQTAVTLEENGGAAVADIDAVNNVDAGWQSIGMRGAPDVTQIQGVSAINITDGVIQITLDNQLDTALNNFVLSLTPNFTSTNTRWTASFTSGTLAATTPSHAVVVDYLNDTMNRNAVDAAGNSLEITF